MFMQEVAQAVTDPSNFNLLPTQFTLSTFCVWFIDALKRWNHFPWLTNETQKLNTLVGIIAAAITAAGIHLVMESEATAGAYTIHITGLTLAGTFHFFKGFAVAIASQQTILKIYQITNTLREIAGNK